MTDPDPGFFEVVFAQRACRAFAADEVPSADLDRILGAAVHAPSAENRQPWHFVVVRDATVRRELDDLARGLWAGGGRDHAAANCSPALLAEVDAAMEAGHGGAPVLVVVAGDRSAVPRSVLGSSIFPAVQNLLLAATALGYGSALTTLATAAPDAVRAIVALPDELEPMAVIPIGQPARPLGPPRRDPASTRTHADRYGTPVTR